MEFVLIVGAFVAGVVVGWILKSKDGAKVAAVAADVKKL